MSELKEGHLVLPNLFTLTGNPEVRWRPWRDGVEICALHEQENQGSSSALLRYAPGARIPQHEHVGYEHIIVLAGSQSDEHGTYRTGTLVINPPGRRHTVHSAEGCTVLAIWQQPVRFVGDGS